MSELTVVQQQLPDPNELYNQGKAELGNLRELRVGQGSTVFFTDKEGSRWGHINFESAKAYIKIDGSAKFKTAAGDVLMSTDATDGNFINVINTALNTASKTILSDFTFQDTDYQGAFKAGNPTWDAGTGLITGGSGVLINARGILGAASGVATFTLDATTGNATFAGTLTAASGTLGSITIGTNAWHVDSSGNMWWGNFASYAAASIKVSSAGLVAFSGGTFTGTVKALGSSATSDVWVDGSAGSLRFFYNNVEVGYLYCSSSAQLLLASVDDVYISAVNGGDVTVFSGLLTLISNSDITSVFNDNGGTDSARWINDTSLTMEHRDSGDLAISGSYL